MMKKKKMLQVLAMAMLLAMGVVSGCSGETKIQEKSVEKTREKEEKAEEKNIEIDQSGFLAFEEKELPEWNYEDGNYPQTFYVTFSDLSDQEREEAWDMIQVHDGCEKVAVLEGTTMENMLEAAPENINPAYLEWHRSKQNTNQDPRVLKNPGKIVFSMIYTMEGAEENILFETNAIEHKDVFSGNFVVNFTDSDIITVDSYRRNGEADFEEEKCSVKLDKVTTEADWMLDTTSFGLYLKLKKEDFDKIVPEEYRKYEYYVMAEKGKEKELREYVKQVGGYVYEDSYYQ